MTATAMPSDRFWSLIDATVEDEADPEAQLARFHSVLSALAPEEIVAFQQAFDQQMARSYSWDLWGAAYVAHGGASDDSFDYFRHWLISKGRDVYEAVLEAPDDLADLLHPDTEDPLEFEEFSYVPAEVWGEKTGGDPFAPDSDYVQGGPLPGAEPSGRPFDEDVAHLSRRYPKLWERFGEDPL